MNVPKVFRMKTQGTWVIGKFPKPHRFTDEPGQEASHAVKASHISG